MNNHDHTKLQKMKNMKTRVKAILGEHDPHTPSILHFTCTTGKCDTGTNLNKGFFIEACSKCNFQRKPQPVNIERWNTDPEYRHQVDNCPKCGAMLYHKPTGANNQ
jgi:hypothetical protein